MKKIALIAIMLFAISSYAETWLYGDFESGDLSGTVLYDNDGDTNNWEITTTNPFAGTYAVQSVSAGLTPDNWLISPQHYVERYDNVNYPHVKFWIGAADPVNFAEHYQVLVSYTDTDMASFFPIYEETLTSSEWKEIDIDMKPFFGEYQWYPDMYVAIRHFDSDGQSALLFDEISVYTEPSFWFDEVGDFTLTPEGIHPPFSDLDIRVSPYDRSMYDVDWNFVGMDVRMHYILSDGVTPQPEDTLTMIWNDNPDYTDTYICTFTGQPMGTFIEYWFEATDNSELSYVGTTQHFNLEWGEVTFVEDFEAPTIPEEWTVFKTGNIVSNADYTWVTWTTSNVHSGSYSMTSASQSNTMLSESENYLVTPRLRVDGKAKLKYFVNAETPEGYVEKYMILINTLGGDSATIVDQSDTLFIETLPGADDNAWHERVMDLEPWSGNFVWIAFKHINVPIKEKLNRYLNIDDLSVAELPIVTLGDFGNVCLPGAPFEITLTATDYSGINNAKLYYSLDGGTEVEIVMIDNGDDTFLGTIPGQIKDTKAEWYTISTDDSPYSNMTRTDFYDIIWFDSGWLEWGSSYLVDWPEPMNNGYKAAIDWNFGTKDYLYLKKIEVGWLNDAIDMTWKLVEFDETPTDNVIGNYEGVHSFAAGGDLLQVEENHSPIGGHVALLFEVTSPNELHLDESGDKSHSWQYNSVGGWATNLWGAFYIKMYVSTDSSGIGQGEFIANTTELCQNYPNPFNPTTSINFYSNETGKVNLTVYNVAGEKVALLVDGNLKSGYHKISFDASRLNSGVYYYTLITPEANITKKMVLVK